MAGVFCSKILSVKRRIYVNVITVNLKAALRRETAFFC